MIDLGWIKLHRKVLQSDVAGDFTAFGVWCWCLLKANHKQVKWRGKVILPGQFVTGRNAGSRELGIPESAFYRALKRLEKYGYIEQKSNSKATRVTICNWSTYQERKLDGEQRANNERTTSEQPANTNKNREPSKEGSLREKSQGGTPPRGSHPETKKAKTAAESVAPCEGGHRSESVSAEPRRLVFPAYGGPLVWKWGREDPPTVEEFRECYRAASEQEREEIRRQFNFAGRHRQLYPSRAEIAELSSGINGDNHAEEN